MTDPQVMIRRWQAGDERAAETLCNRYRDTTFHLACAQLNDPADAEEVAQDATTALS